MKRIVGLLVAGTLVLGIAGCSRPAATTGTSGAANPTAQSAAGHPAKTWKALELGPNETKRLSTLGPLLKLWADNERKAKRTPADLTGITPKLVGYRLQLWAPDGKGKFTLLTFQITDGRADQLGDFQIPLTTKDVPPVTGQPSHPSEGITPVSAGEKDAIAKGLAWAKTAYPKQQWTAEIQGYEFYYQLKTGYLLFVANAKSTGYLAVGGTK